MVQLHKTSKPENVKHFRKIETKTYRTVKTGSAHIPDSPIFRLLHDQDTAGTHIAFLLQFNAMADGKLVDGCDA